MRSTPELDSLLRLRLIAACERASGGNADAFGRQLGYTNGGYIREIVRGVKPVREALIERVHKLAGYEDWFTALLPQVVASDVAASRPPQFSADELTLIDAYRDLPASQRRRHLEAIVREANVFREHKREILGAAPHPPEWNELKSTRPKKVDPARVRKIGGA